VTVPAENWQDVFFTSRDGLRLYARHYAAPGSRRRPAVCLPGLTRNSRDFHDLASHLSDPSNTAARSVWAVDYRGRGRSAHDPNAQNYSLQIELLDVLDLMTLAGLHDAAVIGTSRGGLLAMVMAAVRPTAIGAVVLNDIGPVIERSGLLRIVAYVGRIPLPATWSEATALVRDLNARQFPGVAEHLWEDLSRQWFNDDHGRPTHAYDQRDPDAVASVRGAQQPADARPQGRALRHSERVDRSRDALASPAPRGDDGIRAGSRTAAPRAADPARHCGFPGADGSRDGRVIASPRLLNQKISRSRNAAIFAGASPAHHRPTSPSA
jgi:pimeloyl-ACP methyl ester carboxylesterase